MAAIIPFKKNEKLAILRIMIEINNYYSSLLPHASKFIQEVANHFGTPDGIYSLTVSEAQNILIENIKFNSLKTDFILNILNYLLKEDKITARYENISEKFKFDYKEIAKAKDDLNNSFRSKWAYAIKLTKKFLDLQFIYQNCNPLEKYSSLNKPTVTKSAAAQQPHIGAIHDKSNASSRKTENINKVSDISFVKDELRKELMNIMRSELKDELRKELIDVRKDLMESIRKNIKEELQKEIKAFAHNNINETLYKDL